MAERIYVMNDKGEIHPLAEEPFDTEDLLQRLVADHPELLDGEQMRPGDPRRWILITREKSIPDTVDAGARWSVDHLLVDQDAIPTLVEVKRGTNTEIRRTVVGQLLEYAAHASRTWTTDELRRTFEDGGDAEGKLAELLQPQESDEVDADAFWERVATNLAARRLRLLFVADRIPDELARVVEFLNEQTKDNIEVLAVEIKQFRGASLTTLVPQVIGRTVAKPTGGAVRKRTKLTLEEFYGCFADSSVARRLITAAENAGARIERGDSGVSIRVSCSFHTSPVTVAWLYPSMEQTYWNGLKGFAFGTAHSDFPLEAKAVVDEMHGWFESHKDIFHGEVRKGTLRAWEIDPTEAAQHVHLLEERLTSTISKLRQF